jgi:hypothetical protein
MQPSPISASTRLALVEDKIATLLGVEEWNPPIRAASRRLREILEFDCKFYRAVIAYQEAQRNRSDPTQLSLLRDYLERWRGYCSSLNADRAACEERLAKYWEMFLPDNDTSSTESSRIESDIKSGVAMPAYTSEWKIVIRQALTVLGPDAGYRKVAGWLDDHCPDVKRPRYCIYENGRASLTYSITRSEAARGRFQSDLTKVRTESFGRAVKGGNGC